MSTRMTIAHGEWGHMWADLFDDAPTVHLELNTLASRASFVAEPSAIIVSIPAALWDELRKHAAMNVSRGDFFGNGDDAEGEVAQ